jgi:hypothetical protein
MKRKIHKSSEISDEAVKAKTGKVRKEWFLLLDSIEAYKMSHKDIARHLYEKYQISSWWSQMVTVMYEKEKGLRDKHERPDGYSISVSKVVPFPINILFNFWNDDNRLSQWLVKDNFTVRSRHLNKNIHITWIDGKTNVDVNFYDKGKNKSQVVVQHNKLSSFDESEKVKLYWKGKLELLAKLNIS